MNSDQLTMATWQKKGVCMIYLICYKKNKILGPTGTIQLTEKEMALFLKLKDDSEDIRTLISQIWQERASVVNQNTLSQLAFRLRIKLKQAAIPLTFTLSLTKGVRIQKDSRCIFILTGNKIIESTYIFFFKHSHNRNFEYK